MNRPDGQQFKDCVVGTPETSRIFNSGIKKVKTTTFNVTYRVYFLIIVPSGSRGRTNCPSRILL